MGKSLTVYGQLEKGSLCVIGLITGSDRLLASNGTARPFEIQVSKSKNLSIV